MKKYQKPELFTPSKEEVSAAAKRLVVESVSNNINQVEDTNLEIGKWYKNTKVEGTFINCQFFGSSEKYGYGIHLNLWSEKWGLLNYEDYAEAMPSEIEKALTEEAKRRGYTTSNTVSLLGINGESLAEQEVNEKFKFCATVDGNKLYSQPAGFGGKILFHDGKWAEITK